VMPLTIAFRRRRPLAAGSTVLIVNALLGFADGYGTSLATGVAWMCGLYAIAVWTDRTRFLAGVGVLVAANWIPYAIAGGDAKSTGIFTWAPILAMVLARGAVRGHQLQAEALAARAELLERERDLRAHEAVAEERARIARELHDLVAHNVSVMVVQAAAANDVFETQPQRAREALRDIERTGRSALTELRRLLGRVRQTDFAPQPGLSGLESLVDGVRAAGLPVTLRVEGSLDDLPTGLDLSAYRIVQEALTNAIKHAGASAAEVRVRRTADEVELEVVDDGAGPSGNGRGQGLIGMRERASLLGGEVEAGPKPGGGFRVRAKLPL
jgi:signal transduction histidine kinase